MGKFIWTVAHNTLSNYYRDTAKSIVGVPIDEVAELIADRDFASETDDNTEAIRRLRSEIAYLSKLQRRIVIAYYFENRKQADIAERRKAIIRIMKNRQTHRHGGVSTESCLITDRE